MQRTGEKKLGDGQPYEPPKEGQDNYYRTYILNPVSDCFGWVYNYMPESLQTVCDYVLIKPVIWFIGMCSSPLNCFMKIICCESSAKDDKTHYVENVLRLLKEKYLPKLASENGIKEGDCAKYLEFWEKILLLYSQPLYENRQTIKIGIDVSKNELSIDPDLDKKELYLTFNFTSWEVYTNAFAKIQPRPYANEQLYADAERSEGYEEVVYFTLPDDE